MRIPRSPPGLSPAQPPPPHKSHWTFLESGLLHGKGWLQSAEPVQADGGPQWAGAAGAEGPGWAGELGWGVLRERMCVDGPMGASPPSTSAQAPQLPL